MIGKDWQLVRRVVPGSAWHAASDGLKGTAAYGTYVNDLTAPESFSKAFSDIKFDQLLFATGDLAVS